MSNSICGGSHLNSNDPAAIRKELNIIRTNLCYVGANLISEPTDYELKTMQALGSEVIALPVGLSLRITSASVPLVDGRCSFISVWLPSAQTITGVKFFQVTSGDYIADNYNGVGLYTYSGGTLTLVASSTNDGNIWKGSTNTIQSKAFSTPYTASAGLYYIGLLHNTSGALTTPSILGGNGTVMLTLSAAIGFDFTNSGKLNSQLDSQASLPASTAMSGHSSPTGQFFACLY